MLLTLAGESYRVVCWLGILAGLKSGVGDVAVQASDYAGLRGIADIVPQACHCCLTGKLRLISALIAGHAGARYSWRGG